jgi:ABC-type branched-subunit amino acid transport system substrate-binding protein
MLMRRPTLLDRLDRGVRAAAVAGAAALLAACASGGGSGVGATASIEPAGAARAETPKQVRIALLLPLAGVDHTAAVAKAMKQAAEMALFERNDPHVQLLVKDDRGTSEGAKAAAEEALKDGAEIILGPLQAKAVPGAAAAARTANVPVVAFSNDRQVAGSGVYLMSFMVQQEVERVVSFAVGQGKKRFAALIPDDAYGRAVEPAFREAVARGGGSIVALESYAPDANGMIGPAKQLALTIKQGEEGGVPVDAVFLPGGQDVLPQLGSVIAYAGIDTRKVKLIGTGGWDYPNIGREATFVGGWYAGPDPRGFQDFSSRFAKTFGFAPPRIATLAYDATSMAIALAGGAAGERYTAANLTRPNGFVGVDGVVRLSGNGAAERGLAVLEVQSFGATVVDPAPGALDGAQLSSRAPRLN